MMTIDNVVVRFGGVTALDNVSIRVGRNQVTGLIGPNGAGKTTLFNCISRLTTPDGGTITFEGNDLLALRPDQIVGVGIARTYQHASLFPDLTVLDNVRVGAHGRIRGGLVRSLVGGGTRRDDIEHAHEAYEILERLGLAEHAYQLAHGLPYGTLKRIEIARALASRPKLMLLDEPASGLTHAEVAELAKAIRSLREDNDLTILLVEHHMALVMGVSDHVEVLNFGCNLASGTPEQVTSNPNVVEAYLGRRRR